MNAIALTKEKADLFRWLWKATSRADGLKFKRYICVRAGIGSATDGCFMNRGATDVKDGMYSFAECENGAYLIKHDIKTDIFPDSEKMLKKEKSIPGFAILPFKTSDGRMQVWSALKELQLKGITMDYDLLHRIEDFVGSIYVNQSEKNRMVMFEYLDGRLTCVMPIK